MSANTWHVQGAMAGFNAINGLLMDVPWMSASLLLGITGMLFVAIMLGGLCTTHLRTVYRHGVPMGGAIAVRSTRQLGGVG